MPKARAPRSVLQEFVHTLWIMPLWAIPFALFFGTLFGPVSWASYRSAYVASLVFSYTIGLLIWAVDSFVRPRVLPPGWTPGKSGIWLHGLLYGGTAIFGSFLAAAILHFAVDRTFLGTPRELVIIGLFAVLFTALISGIIYATMFYRQALDRARSEQEITLARRIQRSFLLTQFPSLPRLEIHAVNIASKQVSGDFYDVVPAGDDAFLLAIADVAGKGVPAALLSSMLQASLRTQAHTEPSVAAVLANINRLVYRSTTVEQFATFFLGRVDERSMRLAYSNAGHNHPIVFRARGGMQALERGGTMVGILEGATFEEDAIDLTPGDRIVFYTDGISEAENAAGEMFGEDRLRDTVVGFPADLSARDVTERILEAVRTHLDGVEAGDDMTVMVLRVLPPSDARPEPRA